MYASPAMPATANAETMWRSLEPFEPVNIAGRNQKANAAPKNRPPERPMVPRNKKSRRETACPKREMYCSGVSIGVPRTPGAYVVATYMAIATEIPRNMAPNFAGLRPYFFNTTAMSTGHTK